MTETDAPSLPPPRRKPPGRKTKPQRGDKQYGRSAITNGHAPAKDAAEPSRAATVTSLAPSSSTRAIPVWFPKS